MRETGQEIQELIDLLDQAAQEMIAKGPLSTLTNYDTCENLGVYLKETVTKLKK